eukprot:3756455-Heterocapsa_arctica.AAC.1
MDVQETTPPWHDDVTGELLDNKKVREAMEKKRSSLSKFCVYDRVPAKDVPVVWEDADATVVRSCWVKVLKADGRTKCRLVAEQINNGSNMDVYAAMVSS